MGSERPEPRAMSTLLRRARRRLAWLTWGLLISLVACIAANAALGPHALPIGPWPAILIVFGLLSLIAPYQRRLLWLSQVHGDLATPARLPRKVLVEEALREARGRRAMLWFALVVLLMALLLGERIRYGPEWQLLFMLAILLPALWYTIRDVRRLARARSHDLRARALRRLFS